MTMNACSPKNHIFGMQINEKPDFIILPGCLAGSKVHSFPGNTQEGSSGHQHWAEEEVAGCCRKLSLLQPFEHPSNCSNQLSERSQGAGKLL